MNQVAEAITGWSLTEAVGRAVPEVFRIVNEHTRAVVDDPVRKVLQTGLIVGLANHTVLLRKVGGEIPVDDSGAPIRDKDGRILGVVLVFRDIAERKRAEEKLQQSERRYRSFIEVTGQWAWVTDVSGQVVEDIPALRKFTGQTYEQAKGAGWAAALHPDDRQRTFEVWNRAVSTKALYEIEYRMRRHNGVYRHLLARGVPILNEQGQVVEGVGTCIDITERNCRCPSRRAPR